jgi:hypothetical protein
MGSLRVGSPVAFRAGMAGPSLFEPWPAAAAAGACAGACRDRAEWCAGAREPNPHPARHHPIFPRRPLGTYWSRRRASQ